MLVILCASDVKAHFYIFYPPSLETSPSDKMRPIVATFIGNRCNNDLELHPNTMHL